MKTSQAGLDFIAEHEGLELTAYPDPGSGGEPWTIGVGRAHGVKQGDTCTKHEALQWLAEDVETAEKAVLRMVDVPLSQNQFDALVSFVFNCGAGNFEKSTLLKLLNAGDYDGAKGQFPRWNKAAGREMAGLTKRRHAEAALFDGEYLA
jgi:lysozyme